MREVSEYLSAACGVKFTGEAIFAAYFGEDERWIRQRERVAYFLRGHKLFTLLAHVASSRQCAGVTSRP